MKLEFGFVAVSWLLLVCLQSSVVVSCEHIDYDPVVTHKVIMNISIGSVPQGSIVLGLFGDITPKTVFNFVSLIVGNTTNSDGILLTYKGNVFHRTIKDFMLQGGDITRQDGWGGMSVYGSKFPDENFKVQNYGAGWFGMANAGPDTNASQFYLSTVLTPWLDDKHTVFGVVLSGMSVVRAIENNPTTGSNPPQGFQKDHPYLVVQITDCGLLPLEKPFTVPRAPVQG